MILNEEIIKQLKHIPSGNIADNNPQGGVSMEYPVYSLGYCPYGTTKAVKGRIRDMISINGTKICRGDLLVGDGDGVAVIPSEQEDDVIEKAIRKHEKETGILDEIATGKSIIDIYGFGRLLAAYSGSAQ